MVSDDVEVVAARIEFQHWHLPASFFDFDAAAVGYLQKRVGFEVFGDLFPDVGPASFEFFQEFSDQLGLVAVADVGGFSF